MFLYALLSKFCSRFVLVGKSIKNTMLFHDFAKHALKTPGVCSFSFWHQCGGLYFLNGCLFGNGHAANNFENLKTQGFWRLLRQHIKNQSVFHCVCNPGLTFWFVCLSGTHFSNKANENVRTWIKIHRFWTFQSQHPRKMQKTNKK